MEAISDLELIMRFLHDVADTGLLIIIMNFVMRYLDHLKKSDKNWMTGLIFGIAGIFSLHFPIFITSDVMLNLTVVLVGMAGIMGSVSGAVTAVAMIEGYRYLLAEGGLEVGIATIVTGAALGVAIHFFEQKRKQALNPEYYLLFGLLFALQAAIWTIAFPKLAGDSFIQLVSAMIFLYPAATFAFRSIMADRYGPLLHPFLEIRNLNAVAAGTARAAGQNQQTTVILAQIDNFKNITDLYGYAIGDKLLLEIHDRIRDYIEPTLLSRCGAQRFLLCSRGYSDKAAVTDGVKTLRELLSSAYQIEGIELRPLFTFGIALGSESKVTLEALLHQSENALAQATEKGQNQTSFYDPEMAEKIVYRSHVQEALRYALTGHEFTLNLQPQFDAGTGSLRGFEALLRWHHPKLGNISPAEFIPIAEKTGDIIEISNWVLYHSCQIFKNELLSAIPNGTISVNISAVQLSDPSFPDTVASILAETGLPAERLELEITESALIASVDTAGKCMTELTLKGVRFALDDFGTGYSSLNYLRTFPIHLVKLDKSFIEEIDGKNSLMTEAIIEFIHRLQLPVVAEGLETNEQYDKLKQWRCDIVQGYLLSKPFPASELEKFMLKSAAI